MNWFADFARQRGKPLAIAEWGLWHQGGTSEWEWNQAGRDNPIYIELKRDWINQNDVIWHVYFMFGDVSHSLWDRNIYPTAIDRFLQVFGANGRESAGFRVSPSIPPSRFSAPFTINYSVPHRTVSSCVVSNTYIASTVIRAQDAQSSSAWTEHDPWSFSDNLVAMRFHNQQGGAAPTITFTNGNTARNGFALVYQLWWGNILHSENDLSQPISVRINNGTATNHTLRPGGRGYRDSYRVFEFTGNIPANATITIQAQGSWNWNSVNYDYIIFR
jgi:hypothetical protein